jgi:CxxC motif-containing protein
MTTATPGTNKGEAQKTSEAREARREMVCIVCPVGCRLRAGRRADGVRVTGNACARGEKYALEEMTHPVRTVTTSVLVSGGHMGLLSVKTQHPVPKDSMPGILRELRGVKARAPVNVGDVILADAAGTGVDVVATRRIRTKNLDL